MNRRGFILGASSLIVAPAIVRAQNIMPVKTMIPFSVATIERPQRFVFRTQIPAYAWRRAYEGSSLIGQLGRIVQIEALDRPTADRMFRDWMLGQEQLLSPQPIQG